jgi:hypothetical protein
LSLPFKREWTRQKPIKPVKTVKPINGADWLTGLTTLAGYFEVSFPTDGTSIMLHHIQRITTFMG